MHMWLIRGSGSISALILASGALLTQVSAQTENIAPLTAEAARGKAIYEGKGNCAICHRIKGAGAFSGPDLSDVGQRRPEQLLTKLQNPDAEINAANRPYRVVLKNGTAVNGRLLNLDTFTIQMMDEKGNLRSFTKTDLKEYNFVAKSPMPSYTGKLSEQEMNEVVAYLSILHPLQTPGRGGRGGNGGGGGAARGPAPPAQEPH